MAEKLNVLVLDIETAPMEVYAWERYDQNIGLSNIKKDWYIMAWAAKWLGRNKVTYMDLSKETNPEDDKPLLKPLWNLLNEADVVITHNGKHFDARKINARFILQGLNPPSPYKHWDTLQLAKQVGAFTSNSLAYLTDKKCKKYKKLTHKKFPGMYLWAECLKRNPKAWEEMKRYNIHDVLSTEELALLIKSWAPKSFPDFYAVKDQALECTKCGGAMSLRGPRPRSGGFLVKTFQCNNCGSWYTGKKYKEDVKEAA